MQFAWVEKLKSDVPSDWAPELEPAQPGERLLGVLPEELQLAVVTGMWATKEASAVKKAHHGVCTGDPDSCRATYNAFQRLEVRGASLGMAAIEEARDLFGLTASDEVALRQEGLVLLPPDPLEAAMEDVAKLMGLAFGKGIDLPDDGVDTDD